MNPTAMVRPSHHDVAERATPRGLQRFGLLELPAFALLIVGGIWEAYSLRYLIHPLGLLLL